LTATTDIGGKRGQMNKHEENNFAMSLDRLEAFSDGVFSVAVTLLVLSHVVPQSRSSATELLQQLTGQWPAYLAYFTTFMTVGMVWIGHHRMFRYFERIDETILILNLLVLLFITLTPFTTGLVALYIQHTKPGTDQIAVLVYGSNWLLNDLFLGLMWWYARRNHFLKPGLSEAQITGATRGFVGGSIITVFGMFVGLFSAQISLLIYLFIALANASPILRIFAKPQPEVKTPLQ
jgi:uncharacterized membrane protein